MSVHFAVLTSGSRGNATLIQAGGSGLLLDFGMTPRKLGQRLESVGSGWDKIALALLTHTHGDHVDPGSLGKMAELGITLFCHFGHQKALRRHPQFRELDRRGLVKCFEDRPLLLPLGMRVEPFALPHGTGPTYGFRVEARPDRGSRWVSVGYLADLGHWSSSMVEAVAEVDLLAVEFNHDVKMQWGSGRPPALIARNLGKNGHLSNDQGADFVSAVMERSKTKPPRHVVLLHMSEQCNSPDIAVETARKALRGSKRRPGIHATSCEAASPNLLLGPTRRRVTIPMRRPVRRTVERSTPLSFPWEVA
jgi:phosphoribosyl 1,2-cyclic phosphodiesterase